MKKLQIKKSLCLINNVTNKLWIPNNYRIAIFLLNRAGSTDLDHCRSSQYQRCHSFSKILQGSWPHESCSRLCFWRRSEAVPYFCGLAKHRYRGSAGQLNVSTKWLICVWSSVSPSVLMLVMDFRAKAAGSLPVLRELSTIFREKAMSVSSTSWNSSHLLLEQVSHVIYML